MVFVHFVLVSIENSVLAVDERSNYLFSRYLVPLIASLLMAPISYVFKSRASASRRAKLSELIEKGNVSQLLALSKVYKRHRSDLLASVLRVTHRATSRNSKKKTTRVIDALLAENLLETSQPVDNFGWTLLHRAVYENNIQLVEVLLKHDAGVGVPDTNGNTALHVAIQSCQGFEKSHSQLSHNINSRLINGEDGPVAGNHEGDALIHAHYVNVLDLVKRLITASKAQSSPLLNKANYFGKTPLHYAVLLQPNCLALQILEYLIAEGADVDRMDARGRTPLYHLLTTFKYTNSSMHRYKLMHIIMTLVRNKCDKLCLMDMLGDISSLKHLSRQVIKQQLNTESDFLKSQLPSELVTFLKRRILI